ncbi:hypothetical protein CXF86_15375 [Shewanella sp. GutCb]|nr:hypothetical protein CXF86_15375 [Shewanella sp. GutCb]
MLELELTENVKASPSSSVALTGALIELFSFREKVVVLKFKIGALFSTGGTTTGGTTTGGTTTGG